MFHCVECGRDEETVPGLDSDDMQCIFCFCGLREQGRLLIDETSEYQVFKLSFTTSFECELSEDSWAAWFELFRREHGFSSYQIEHEDVLFVKRISGYRPVFRPQISGWIGVDLDGTLAYYTGWRGRDHIGNPVPRMANRVRSWLRSGLEVRIFTARADDEANIPYIKEWLQKWGFGDLQITNVKDRYMLELWDDRAKQVIPNTGRMVGE